VLCLVVLLEHLILHEESWCCSWVKKVLFTVLPSVYNSDKIQDCGACRHAVAAILNFPTNCNNSVAGYSLPETAYVTQHWRHISKFRKMHAAVCSLKLGFLILWGLPFKLLQALYSLIKLQILLIKKLQAIYLMLYKRWCKAAKFKKV